MRCLLNPRSRWGELVFRKRGRYRLVVSDPILAEIAEVLGRPEVATRFRHVEGADLAMVQAILAEAVNVVPADIAPVCRGPKDDVFIATAVAAGAAFIVSEDRDLLDIGDYEGIRIVDAETFLNMLA